MSYAGKYQNKMKNILENVRSSEGFTPVHSYTRNDQGKLTIICALEESYNIEKFQSNPEISCVSPLTKELTFKLSHYYI